MLQLLAEDEVMSGPCWCLLFTTHIRTHAAATAGAATLASVCYLHREIYPPFVATGHNFTDGNMHSALGLRPLITAGSHEEGVSAERPCSRRHTPAAGAH